MEIELRFRKVVRENGWTAKEVSFIDGSDQERWQRFLDGRLPWQDLTPEEKKLAEVIGENL
jgi:hypothetical protein